MHVVQAEGIRRIRSCINRFALIGTAVASGGAVVEIGLRRGDAGTGRVWGRRSTARCVLPFRLGGQAIPLAGLVAEPFHISLRIVPRDINDRSLATAPTGVFRQISGAAAFKRTDFPIIEGNLELGYGERPVDVY